MIRVYRFGRMEIGLYETPTIIGRIEKVRIIYGTPEAEDMHVSISTSDREKLIDVQGAEDSLFYPRNWDVANEKYVGGNIAAEGQSVMNAERYLSTGKLHIFIEGSEGDFVQEIQITAEVEEQTISIVKSEGMVTTETEGVHSSGFSPDKERRRRMLSKYAESVWQSKEFIDKAGELTKADTSKLRKYIEESLYSYKFDGITQKISTLIKDYILRSIVKNYPKERVLTYMANKGVDPKQSNLIYRTETQALRTKVREWSYKELDPEEQLKYKWLGPTDERTTSTCKAIASRTSKGVSLSELKRIVQEETDNAKGRGELPKDYDAREYTPHFQCRHTFIRAYN